MSCQRRDFSYEILNIAQIDTISMSTNTSTPSTTTDFRLYDEEHIGAHERNSTLNTLAYNARLGANVVNQLFIFGLTVFICSKCFGMGLQKTAVHASLCTLGLILFLGQAIMTPYMANVLLVDYRPPTKVLLHVIFNTIGILLSGSGTMCKYNQKKLHFLTRHGKLGIVSMTLVAVNVVCGICFFTISSTRTMNFIHSCLGTCAFLVSVAAQYTGYDTGFFRRNFQNITCYKVATLLIVILSSDGLLQYIIALITNIFF